MTSTSRGSNNVCNVDVEVFMRIEAMCKELRKEKDMLKESLFNEKSRNEKLIQRLESNATSQAILKEERYIEELERELKNCSLEIGYLQDQLNLRHVESNCIGEHVHSLELKLTEVGTLHKKLKLLTEALVQSNSKQVMLLQEINSKDNELQNSALQIEELETAVSSIALESQCEIECMKLEIAALEEKCFEADRLSQQATREKSEIEVLLEKSNLQFQEAQERIHCIEMENKELRQKLKGYEEKANVSYCKLADHLDTWLNSRMSLAAPGVSCREMELLLELAKEVPLLKQKCNCEEVLCPFVSNPALDDNLEETKMMSNQICEYELQVAQLKEELKTEKLKAKEEAEDLTQEMAELRYQITDMLEEECKRRASIEQASLRRIQDLEEQVQRERNRSLAAVRRFQEEHKLAQTRSLEIKHLKNALEGFRQVTDPEAARRIESFNCVNGTTSENSYDSSKDTLDSEATSDYPWHQASIGWYTDDEAPSTEVGGR